jgi:two-component system sensor histidine kinase UhpB
MSLTRSGDGVVLRVGDDGLGADPAALHDAGGVGGMRERAMLVGGHISIGASDLGGTEVRLELPGAAR